ncbi:TetR/AcrR family transcriptional regulator [Paenibacillus taichungensis]|uniref:TetR/AcrR family transcriptional regulator n=1 Tax=Paenibacillus taichungensis TaxID=484184 RepID=A0A329QN51_9BACL|nr:TetR/AcrR family transcriptional regulator [Paenibacillus taichungensis]RAW13351.1 TetR/AcrR family transcriptional regulator [Paenibacillus taichungensis]
MEHELKKDRRKIRTKKLIRQALLELTAEKGLSKISVMDLAERAEINRGTFYLHYKDVADLVDQLKKEIFEGIKILSVELNPLEVGHYAERGEPYPAILKLLEYLLSHADYLRIMLSPNGDLQLPIQIKELIAERMLQHFETIMPNDPAVVIPWDYFLAFTSSASIGLLTHWMEQGNDLSTREVALMITQINSRGPLETLMRRVGNPHSNGREKAQNEE